MCRGDYSCPPCFLESRPPGWLHGRQASRVPHPASRTGKDTVAGCPPAGRQLPMRARRGGGCAMPCRAQAGKPLAPSKPGKSRCGRRRRLVAALARRRRRRQAGAAGGLFGSAMRRSAIRLDCGGRRRANRQRHRGPAVNSDAFALLPGSRAPGLPGSRAPGLLGERQRPDPSNSFPIHHPPIHPSTIIHYPPIYPSTHPPIHPSNHHIHPSTHPRGAAALGSVKKNKGRRGQPLRQRPSHTQSPFPRRRVDSRGRIKTRLALAADPSALRRAHVAPARPRLPTYLLASMYVHV